MDSPVEISRISVSEAAPLLADRQTVFVDVRDPGSFTQGHIPGARHVNDHNIQAFIDQADKSLTHVIYCYHGYSSQGGTAFFLSQGFTDVRSLDGGFTYWQQVYPEQVEAGQP